MPDLYVFPFAERVVLLNNSPWMMAYDMMKVQENAPTIIKYVNNFRALPQFKNQIMSEKAYHKYLDRYKESTEGHKPAFELSFVQE